MLIWLMLNWFFDKVLLSQRRLRRTHFLRRHGSPAVSSSTNCSSCSTTSGFFFRSLFDPLPLVEFDPQAFAQDNHPILVVHDGLYWHAIRWFVRGQSGHWHWWTALVNMAGLLLKTCLNPSLKLWSYSFTPPYSRNGYKLRWTIGFILQSLSVVKNHRRVTKANNSIIKLNKCNY